MLKLKTLIKLLGLIFRAYKRRKIREVIEIEKFPLNLNRDDGLKLNECWRPIICHLKKNNTHKKQKL